MSAFSCEIDYDNAFIDYRFIDYREKLALSDGTITCCETGILIPRGQPYAACQGVLNGELWDTYDQALEVWRFLRQLKQSEGSCFAFQGVDETLSYGGGDQASDIIKARWNSLVKKTRLRYANGGGPRLHKWEKLALESGKWFNWIQYPSGGQVFRLSEDGVTRTPVAPSHPGGEPWVAGYSSQVCASCNHRCDADGFLGGKCYRCAEVAREDPEVKA